MSPLTKCEEETKLKQKTAHLSIISNSLLILLKLIVGLWTGAVSLVSEALHSGVDLLAALIAYWAVHMADRPPDGSHDYGHGKAENLSAAMEALLLFSASLLIIYHAVTGPLLTGEVPENLEYGTAIMAVSIIVNLIVSTRLLKVAKITYSQALEADGLHLRADIWTSVGVLLGLLAIDITGWAWLDAAIAICVAGVIFREGWQMLRSSVLELTDASLPDSDEERLGQLLESMPEVRGYHCLRTRRVGSYRLVDVHLLLDGAMRLRRVHEICDELEKRIHRELGAFDITIHPEPVGDHLPETKASQYEENLAVGDHLPETKASQYEENLATV